MKTKVIYGINKFAGTKSDRQRIAKEYKIMDEDVVNGKEICIDNISIDWFITDKYDRAYVDLELWKD